MPHPDPVTEHALARIRSLIARADAADAQAQAYQREIGTLLEDTRKWARQASRRSKYSDRYGALGEQIASADLRIKGMQTEIRTLGRESDQLREDAAKRTAEFDPHDLAYL